MLDTKSLMQASVCCTMFNKCAMDRVCYSHIDLTMAAKNVDNGVVCIMIHRAGKELRLLLILFYVYYQYLRSLVYALQIPQAWFYLFQINVFAYEILSCSTVF